MTCVAGYAPGLRDYAVAYGKGAGSEKTDRKDGGKRQ